MHYELGFRAVGARVDVLQFRSFSWRSLSQGNLKILGVAVRSVAGFDAAAALCCATSDGSGRHLQAAKARRVAGGDDSGEDAEWGGGAARKQAPKKGPPQRAALDAELPPAATLIPPAIAELSADGFVKPKCAPLPSSRGTHRFLLIWSTATSSTQHSHPSPSCHMLCSYSAP